MKKRKLLCLLALVACFTAPLAACGDNKEAEAGKAFDKHFYWEDDRKAYSQVVRYDGYVDSVDEAHNLAVIYSEKNNSDGSITEKYQVMDLIKGVSIETATLSKPVGGNDDTLSVELDYPVIKVTRSWTSNDEREYRYSYYLAREDYYDQGNYYDNTLAQDSKYDDLEVNRIGSLYKVEYADKEIWVNDKLEVLREFSDAQTDGYATPDIDGAYGDYLYAWSFDEVSRQIQVFNREGVCSMQYTYPSDVVWLGYAEEPVILNNGNILVQEHTFAEETATDYTYKAFLGYSEMTKMDVVSKIIDYKTGEATEVELDYILFDLQAAYDEESGYSFPFQVRESAQNQAYIAKIVNKEISTIDYVTINNEGKIGYTVKNDYLRGQANTLMGNPWTDIGFVNEKYYYADVYANAFSEDDAMETWIFDKSGNKVAELPVTWDWDAYEMGSNAITDEYIITWNGIYDYNKKCVYDFTKSELLVEEDVNMALMVYPDGIYLSGMNYNLFQFEVYKFDGKDFVKVEESVMEMDASSEYDLPKGNKVTFALDIETAFLPMMGAPTGTWTLYNEKGEALVKMQVNVQDIDDPDWFYQCEGAALIETETLDGEPIVYVVK